MRFDIVTIFPGFFGGVFEYGIVRRARAEGLVTAEAHDLRAFTHDRHRTVDDRPFGGGEGMVLKPEPLAEALASLGVGPKAAGENVPCEGTASQVVEDRGNNKHLPRTMPQGLKPIALSGLIGTTEVVPFQSPPTQSFSGDCSAVPPDAPDLEGASTAREDSQGRPFVVLMSAQGRRFTQAVARQFAAMDRVVLICGRYEGVDERINQLYCDMELSIGDYVLSGGELAAAVVVDAVMRLVPGVLGNEASGEFESFGVADTEISSDQDGVPRSQHGAGGLLDYPHYTRPAEFGGVRVPETLLNGDHSQIRRWRREQQLRKTLENRPDLLEGAELSGEDRKILESLRG